MEKVEYKKKVVPNFHLWLRACNYEKTTVYADRLQLLDKI